MLLKGELAFLPVSGPLTSALLLLANCDAADTLVMFLPLLWGPSLAIPPRAQTIFGAGSDVKFVGRSTRDYRAAIHI